MCLRGGPDLAKLARLGAEHALVDVCTSYGATLEFACEREAHELLCEVVDSGELGCVVDAEAIGGAGVVVIVGVPFAEVDVVGYADPGFYLDAVEVDFGVSIFVVDVAGFGGAECLDRTGVVLEHVLLDLWRC